MFEKLKIKLGKNYYKLINFYSIIFFLSFLTLIPLVFLVSTFIGFNELLDSSNYFKYIVWILIPNIFICLISIYGFLSSFKNKIFLSFSFYRYVKNNSEYIIEIMFFSIFTKYLLLSILFSTLKIIDSNIFLKISNLLLFSVLIIYLYDFYKIIEIIKHIYSTFKQLTSTP